MREVTATPRNVRDCLVGTTATLNRVASRRHPVAVAAAAFEDTPLQSLVVEAADVLLDP
jgi:hypothetical protein